MANGKSERNIKCKLKSGTLSKVGAAQNTRAARSEYDIISIQKDVVWSPKIEGSASQQAAELLKRKQLIEEKLESSGKKKEFEEYLKKRLVEVKWKDQMKQLCMGKERAKRIEIIKAKGIEKIKLEELTEEMMPKGKALVPDAVKNELLQKIQDFIEADPDYQKLYD